MWLVLNTGDPLGTEQMQEQMLRRKIHEELQFCTYRCKLKTLVKDESFKNRFESDACLPLWHHPFLGCTEWLVHLVNSLFHCRNIDERLGADLEARNFCWWWYCKSSQDCKGCKGSGCYFVHFKKLSLLEHLSLFVSHGYYSSEIHCYHPRITGVVLIIVAGFFYGCAKLLIKHHRYDHHLQNVDVTETRKSYCGTAV